VTTLKERIFSRLQYRVSCWWLCCVCRLQFKHYIDELRAIRHGSLTGMKFEDIVNSVSAIIEGHAVSLLWKLCF